MTSWLKFLARPPEKMERTRPASPVPPPVSARNDFVDYLKGALIFLVVCGHLIQFVIPLDQTPFYSDPLFKAIYTFHMPLFMAVSGFVSFHSIFTTTFLSCTLRRIRQLIVPAICWPVLFLMISLLLYILHLGLHAGIRQVLMKSPREYSPGLWFLWAVFGSTVVVSALKKIDRDRLEYFMAAAFIFLFAPDKADIYLFKYTFPFFCIGYALAKGDQIRLPRSLPPVLVVTLFAAGIGCYRLWGIETYIYTTKMQLACSNLQNIGLRYFAGIVISACFVLLMLFCYRIAVSKILSNWGRHSLDIYIIHCYVLDAFLELVDIPMENSLWFSFLAVPVLAMILCTITCQIGRGLRRIPVTATLLLGQTSKT